LRIIPSGGGGGVEVTIITDIVGGGMERPGGVVVMITIDRGDGLGEGTIRTGLEVEGRVWRVVEAWEPFSRAPMFGVAPFSIVKLSL
jgi:hypothetical protein